MFGYPERPLSTAAAGRLIGGTARRAARAPLAHIVGVREFWSLAFRVTSDVLIPRPDSETVIEAVLAAGPPPDARLLDLGTGSGCLLLALLHERPRWSGVGIDRAPDAVAVARANADALGLADRAAFLAGDWAAPLTGRFEVIVSNPPYIPSDQIAALEPEVRDHEPPPALDGGPDGLDAVRRVAAAAARHLTGGGLLACEVGIGQADAVTALLAEAGFAGLDQRRDLGGVPRCVTGWRKTP